MNGENPSARNAEPPRRELPRRSPPSPTGERPTANTENPHTAATPTHQRTADRQHREPPHRSPPTHRRTAGRQRREPRRQTPTSQQTLNGRCAGGRPRGRRPRNLTQYPADQPAPAPHPPTPSHPSRLRSLQRRSQRPPTPRPHPNQRPLPPLPTGGPHPPSPTPATGTDTGTGTGPNTSASAGSSTAARNSATASAPPRHRSHPRHRRKPQLPRSASSRTACPTGSHRTSACTGRRGRFRHHDHSPPTPEAAPANPPRSTAATRPPPGPQIRPPEHRPPVEQQRRRIPPVGNRLGPGVLTTNAGVPGTVSSTCSRPDVRTGTAGNARPNSSAVRRAPTICARNRNPPHSGQCQEVSSTPHHPQRSTPASCPSNGPAQCRHRAAARHWAHAIRGTYPRRGTCTSTGPCFSPSRTACHANVGNRAARAASSRAKSPSPRSVRAARPTAPGPATRPTASPTRSRPAARPDGAAPTPQQEPALVLSGSQQQHLPRMRLRRVRLAVTAVPVVPDHDEPQILDRREHRGPGPDDRPHGPRRTASHCRYRFGPGIGGEHRVPPLPSRAVSAASTLPAARPSGTTTSAPAPRRASRRRPERSPRSTRARAARSRQPAAHPRSQRLQEPGPRSYRAQDPTSGASGGGNGAGEAFCSARALRGGTASCNTSARLPAYRSATARASPSNSALSTGSGDTT